MAARSTERHNISPISPAVFVPYGCCCLDELSEVVRTDKEGASYCGVPARRARRGLSLIGRRTWRGEWKGGTNHSERQPGGRGGWGIAWDAISGALVWRGVGARSGKTGDEVEQRLGQRHLIPTGWEPGWSIHGTSTRQLRHASALPAIYTPSSSSPSSSRSTRRPTHHKLLKSLSLYRALLEGSAVHLRECSAKELPLHVGTVLFALSLLLRHPCKPGYQSPPVLSSLRSCDRQCALLVTLGRASTLHFASTLSFYIAPLAGLCCERLHDTPCDAGQSPVRRLTTESHADTPPLRGSSQRTFLMSKPR